MQRLLLLRSGDRVPNTHAASLRDARLTDSRLGQSLPGPLGKVDFPNELIGRRRGRALVIGVLLGVESSKQPRSTARARDARAPVLALGSAGLEGARETKGAHSGRQRRVAQESEHERVGVLRARGR